LEPLNFSRTWYCALSIAALLALSLLATLFFRVDFGTPEAASLYVSSSTAFCLECLALYLTAYLPPPQEVKVKASPNASARVTANIFFMRRTS
jgi:hypothetical protein